MSHASQRPLNKFLLAAEVCVFTAVLLFIYVPGLNDSVFHHGPVYGEGWGIALAGLLMYMLGSFAWKLWIKGCLVERPKSFIAHQF